MDNVREIRKSGGSSKNLIRLIDKNNGRDEMVSLTEALRYADDMGTELLEVQTKNGGYIYKIADSEKDDYRKMKEKRKRQFEQRARRKTKEISLGVHIADNDLHNKVNSIKRLLSKAGTVRVKVVLKGREKAYSNMAFELLERCVKMVEQVMSRDAVLVTTPRKMGNQVFLTIQRK